MSEKLFAVFPGWVRSIGDWEWHRIGAAQLMSLYRVRQRECLIFDYERPERGHNDGHGAGLDRLMPLRPLTSGGYRPVTDYEREVLRRDGWWG